MTRSTASPGYEPEAEVWVLDDCTGDGTYEGLVQWGGDHPRSRILRNPEPRGYRGIARSMFGVLAEIAAEPRVPGLVVKIDPDTCLLAGGVCDLMRTRLAAAPGIVGAYRVSPTGAVREFGQIRRNMLLDLLPIGTPQRPASRSVSAKPYWAPFVSRARQNGYAFGEHVLGALSEAARRLPPFVGFVMPDFWRFRMTTVR